LDIFATVHEKTARRSSTLHAEIFPAKNSRLP